MRTGRCLGWTASSLPLTMALLAAAPAACAQDPKTPGSTKPGALFNGRDLSGWYVWIDHHDGSDPHKDPLKVFQVKDGLIHVSGEEFGCLATEKEYANYRLTVEFKWGQKKWPPRENAVRDSGILMHCVGRDKVWPKSIECQIQEGDCGDFWMVDNTSIVVNGARQQGGRAVKKTDAEKPTGEWNTIEVVCNGDKITNIVNGVVVNEGTQASVTRGKIVLQSEGAEVYYRKVELAPLGK